MTDIPVTARDGDGLASAAPATGTMRPAKSGVKVRMYRQGFGDCFLLCFADKDGQPVYMLIDCGLIAGEPQDVMTRVVKDIRDATGDRLHYLLVTHEHYDHVSGFAPRPPAPSSRSSGRERRSSGSGSPGRKTRPMTPRGGCVRAAARLSRRCARWSPAWPRSAGSPAIVSGRSRTYWGFFGDADVGDAGTEPAPGPADGLGAAKAGGNGAGTRARKSQTQVALEYAVSLGKVVKYRRPGEPPIELDGVPGVRVYVLGPPTDQADLRRSAPTRSGREVYDMAMTPVGALFGAATAEPDAGDAPGADPGPDKEKDPELRRLWERSLPFDSRYRMTRGAGAPGPVL